MVDLGGGFKYVLFSHLPGEMIQFDEHIFQMGWFNHQPVGCFLVNILIYHGSYGIVDGPLLKKLRSAVPRLALLSCDWTQKEGILGMFCLHVS